MWNIKLSKFKQIYAFTFLPRLFLKESKCLKTNCNVKHLSAVRKNKTSNLKNEPYPLILNDTIVEKADEIALSVRDDLLNGNIISPKYYQIPPCTKCQSVISKLFGIKTHKTPDFESQGIKAQATTATIEEEKLAQKIEIVDETPHVEAHPGKIEGFNSGPKILGQNVCKFDSTKEKITSANQGISSVDELAKRCLDSRVGDIDKALLNEFKNIKTKSKSAINSDIDYTRKFEYLEKESLISEQNKNYNESGVYMYEGEETISEFKVEKIQPLHLDTFPLFTTDDDTRDFISTGFFKDSSPVLKASIEETVMELPSQLSPYDQQAIPFYEYTNKEHVFEDDPELQAAAITETIRENEFDNPIQAEETLRKGALDQRKRAIENPETEEPLRPQPTLHHIYEPLLTFHGEVDDFSRSFKADHISNIFVTQQLLSSTDYTSNWRSDGISLREENNSANSAISGTLPYPPRTSTSTGQLETPPNTAISAHQNPGEYFDWKMPVQFSPHSPLNPYTSTPRMLIEHSVTQNVAFASLPELQVSEKSSQINNDMADTNTSLKTPECMNQVHPANISDTRNVPLSIILKRIQEQSKLDYCRDLFSKAKADVIQANKGNCPPPPANNPPKAGPCKPIAKPKDDNPCPPPKKKNPCKDPCAKFLPFFFNILYKTYNTSDIKIPFQCTATALLYKTKISTPSLALLTEDVIESLKKLGKTLSMTTFSNNALFARDYQPWIPIPSLPYPKLEEKRPFLCPKDGCVDPKSRKRCKDKQNLGESRKNMLSNLPSYPLCLPNFSTCAN